jgi:hypothetical protein
VKSLQASSPVIADSKKTSAAIRQGVQWAAGVAPKMNTSTSGSQIRKRRPAEVFNADNEPGPIFSAQPELSCSDGVQNFVPPLISIGPNTDTALDRFNLGDDLLPKLRVLISTVRSSRWESVFRSQKWDLTYEQASFLSRALLADLQGMPLNANVAKVSSTVYDWLHIYANGSIA